MGCFCFEYAERLRAGNSEVGNRDRRGEKGAYYIVNENKFK